MTTFINGVDTVSSITVTAARTLAMDLSDQTGEGIIINDTLGETVAISDCLYMDGDGKWDKTDADAAATMPARGIALAGGNVNDDIDILVSGIYRDDTKFAWTPGAILYVSEATGAGDAGDLQASAPAGSGDQVQSVGVALTADIILFEPNDVLVEVT